jgi:hypothetical protein
MQTSRSNMAQGAFRRGTRTSQRGQSLAEVAVACIVLVPMFLMIGLLGQYMHLRVQTQQAARTAAWDAAVHPNLVKNALPATAGEQDRFLAWQYGTTDVALKTNPGTTSKVGDTMFTTFAGRDLVLARNVTLTKYTDTESPAVMSKALDKIGAITSKIGLGSFPPDREGLISAEVHAKPEHITGASGQAIPFLDPLDHMDLDFYGRTVLLADAWDANGPGEAADGSPLNDTARKVRAAIRPLTPANYLGDKADALVDKVRVLLQVPVISELAGFFMAGIPPEIGKAAPDDVPSDKLKRYGSK